MSGRILKWVTAGLIYLAVVIAGYYVFEDVLVQDVEPEQEEHAVVEMYEVVEM